MAKKILVIEDDKSLLFMFRSMLEKAGFAVETAENGQIGLDKVDKFQPDLILLDIMLPVMDGYEVLKNLKPALSAPIIVLTGLNNEEVEQKAKNFGADDFIRKDNIHLTELLEKVNSALEK